MTVIATAGHVDHGKSSLVRALTGIEPDRLEEERRKGMTIDLGFAHTTLTDGTTLSFVDVPGHADFVRTMIAGVTGVDVALLVIDAGEGWKPQTEEHLGILGVLGVGVGVVALTKCDRVDTASIDALETDVRMRLSTSPVHWTSVVRTSAHTGDGLDTLVGALSGAVSGAARGSREGCARLFVDRVFTMKGSGTVVTGTLDTDSVRAGDSLVVVRDGHSVRVRAVQVHGREVEVCTPGSRCALNLTGVSAGDIERGDALVAPDRWITTDVFDARVSVLESVGRPLTHRGSFTVHVGSGFQSATVRVIAGDRIEPGTNGRVRIRFARPLPLVPGDRFLLRDTGTNTTVGGGEVLDVDPLTRLTLADPDGSVESIMRGRGFVPLHTARMLTGRDLEPVAGNLYATDAEHASAVAALAARLDGGNTVALADLDDVERDLLSCMPDVVVEAGVARRGQADPLLSHPLVSTIRAWGLTGPSTAGLDRNVMRQLVQRGIVFEHDSIAFHTDTLDDVRDHLDRLWLGNPDGVTVSQIREALGITRKHAVPLAECLDRAGITRRQGDKRVRGRAG